MAKTYTTSLNEYPIPQSDGLEMQVIADIVVQPDLITEAEKIISHDMFENDDCRSAWMALKRMVKEGLKIDLPSVYSRINRDLLQKGIIPLMAHSGGVSTSLQHFAELKDMHVKRKCYFKALELLSFSTDPSVRADEMIQQVGSFSEKLRKDIDADKGTQHISAVINDLADNLGKVKRDKALGHSPRVPTGFRSLDFLTYGGFNAGNLIILAARPSVGKTAVMLQMARAAAQAGKKVNLFNLEMTNTELAQRFIFSTGKVTPLQMARGDVEWDDFELASAEFTKEPMYLNDKVRTLEDIRSRIILNNQARKCDIAFIDYLGLIKMNSKIPLSQAIAEATSELKHTAKDCGIPIVLLCQLNRSSASEKRAPEMHDLRDSGGIEQDADAVLMLERAGDDEEGKDINIWVRKNRGGKAGNVKIEITANDTYTVFTEKEGERMNIPSPPPPWNPVDALNEEMHRLTRSPFDEPEFDNQFPF